MPMPKGWTKLEAHGIPRLTRAEVAARYRLRHPDRVRRAQADELEAHLARNVMRRARKHGAFVERVFRSVAFLNDSGICQWQYCSEASPFVDPANWHLDHIQPLSKGGEHSYANTQVMHPVCNLRKGSD